MIGLEYIAKEFHFEYKEIAEKIGISPQTLQDWLKERRKIPQKRLEQLSSMFKLPESYFQKKLNFTEEAEIRIQYLKSVSEDIKIPNYTEDGEIVGYYTEGTYEDEIKFLKESLAQKKKQNDIRKNIDNLLKKDVLPNIDEYISDGKNEDPLLTDSSNTETFHKIINVMKDEKISNDFKVMVHLLNFNDELGGKVIKTITPEYREFAGDFLELLKKHKIKN
ncbi:helix-turn-helix domain-containing protein [Peribacillus sp. JNUCC 23]